MLELVLSLARSSRTQCFQFLHACEKLSTAWTRRIWHANKRSRIVARQLRQFARGERLLVFSRVIRVFRGLVFGPAVHGLTCIQEFEFWFFFV